MNHHKRKLQEIRGRKGTSVTIKDSSYFRNAEQKKHIFRVDQACKWF